jgi:hypothetical protein
MKKLLILSIAVISSFLMISQVHAADPSRYQGFSLVLDLKLCEPGMSLDDSAYGFELNSGQESEARDKMSMICKKAGVTTRFAVGYVGMHLFGSTPMFIAVCSADDHTPKKSDGSYIEASLANVYDWWCCPEQYPYAAGDGIPAGGCTDVPKGAAHPLTARVKIPIPIASNSNGKWQINNTVGGGINPWLEDAVLPAYACNEGCAVSSTLYPLPDLYRKALSTKQIGTAMCLPNNTTLQGDSCTHVAGHDGDSCVCHNGASLSKYLLDTVGESGVAIINQCSGGPSNQVDSCVNCLMKSLIDNNGNTTPYYQWSAAFGCVDTRLNAFITRLIQIGMGVGSGIAVIRIIQGAFYRQSNDPSKIQEGNEILFSTFLGLGVLIGAVLILRIIGVDVLGIFTAGQFTSIINN